MIDARVFIDNLANARKILRDDKATLKGMYAIHDTIYRNRDESIPISEEFLRLRQVPENIWDDKPFILALKRTELRKVGKSSIVPIKLEFDNLNDAEKYYEHNFKEHYVEDFSFNRVGWQYFMTNGDGVDLEIIEDTFPTIEFKSTTEDGIRELLGRFAISNEIVIQGPSIIAIRELLKV